YFGAKSNDGRLRFGRQSVVYKSSKTGKVDMTTSTGHIYKYDGFRDTGFEKISEYFKAHYKVELSEKELCVKGWNWGTAKFSGPLLAFEVSDSPAFEIPLASVSQCATGKNEVTLEFHQNDEAEVSLTEFRFYVPPGDTATTEEGPEPVEVFRDSVLSKADVIQATGDAVCIFKELQCLTPRGRYIRTHKPYSYVPLYFVTPLPPPPLSIKLNSRGVEKRYRGKLNKNMSGSLYEMVSRVMKALVNKKITVPGNFLGHSGTQCITCSYKASSGLLYPLERGFVYVHKPPMHLRFEEVSCVNFARGTTTTTMRSFDFEIETKQGTQFIFSSIESIKNRGFKEVNISPNSDEDEHDAYLERMKEEGKIREEANDSDDSDGESGGRRLGQSDGESNEYDSKASASDSSAAGGDSDREKKKKRPAKKAKLVKERKPCKKKPKDSGAPKRPMSTYFLWLNTSHDSIKAEHPGISITEISKRAGEMWRELGKEQKVEGGRGRERERERDQEYRKSGGGSSAHSKKFSIMKKKGGKSDEENKKGKSGGGRERERETGNDSFKSREFIYSEESSSESEGSDEQEEEVALTPPSSDSGSD
uniref:Structure specific recognition protein 1 n=1 Tax=Salmo trutta TaxID=8032 RepID=A0A674C7K5_SALTR